MNWKPTSDPLANTDDREIHQTHAAPTLLSRVLKVRASPTITRLTSLLVSTVIAVLIGIAPAACVSKQAHTATASSNQITDRPWPKAGHLVIVGGGLEDDNALIYQRFLALAGHGPVLIIPTASGEWQDAATSAQSRFRRHATSTIAIESLPISQDDLSAASDPAIVSRIDAATAIWFTGGDQSRITRVFRPDGLTSPALAAMDRLLARGGVIGGTSAGAAIMSDPMIAGGRATSQRRSDTRDRENPAPQGDQPAPAGVRFAPGLGFFPHGLVDQHFLERNRLPRLLEALQQSQIPTGFGINENTAMVVDLESLVIEGLGQPAVVIVQTHAQLPVATILSNRSWQIPESHP